MNFSFQQLLYAAILTAVPLAVLLLATAIYHSFLEPLRKRRKVDQLLKDSGEYMRRALFLKERTDQQAGLGWGQWMKVLGSGRLARIQTLMLQADVYQTPGRFWGQFLLLDLAACFIFYMLTKNLWVVLLIAVTLASLPYFYLVMKKNRKAAAFESLMPDAMELLARSLRAGHTLPSAIELLGEEMDDPIGTEMKIAYEEQKLGIGIADSLLHMLQRVDSLDLRYFVSAVVIQQETGGNLAELMENIARVVRNRLNYKAKVRALAASGRFSASIMIAAPFVAFLGLMLVAPDYEKILTGSPVGIKILIGGAILAALGAFQIRRMVRALGT
jgi:tight adherence protein B